MPYNLTCTAPEGRPAANVTWYRDNVPAAGETFTTVTAQGKLEDSIGKIFVISKIRRFPLVPNNNELKKYVGTFISEDIYEEGDFLLAQPLEVFPKLSRTV